MDPTLAADPSVLLDRASSLYVISDDLSIRYANPGTARALGWQSAAEPSEPLVTALVHPADRPLLAGVIRELPAGGRSRQLQVRLRHTNGSWRTIAVVAHDMSGDDRVGGLLLEGWDITEHLDELRATSLTDPLTGLANRALLGDRLRRSLALLRRSITPVGLLFVDLNEFKAVNDNYGHPAGDRVLSAVSARIGRVLRPQDTLCRWGGDEFVVLCAELDSPGDAVRVAGPGTFGACRARHPRSGAGARGAQRARPDRAQRRFQHRDRRDHASRDAGGGLDLVPPTDRCMRPSGPGRA